MTLNLSLVSGSDGIKNGRQHPGPEQQEGQECCVSGRRASGSFTLKKLDGTRISKGVTFKKIAAIRACNKLSNRKDVNGQFLPRLKSRVSLPLFMKAEIKFANTSNGPKAFVKTFDDDWTPMSTPLKAYKKDMRSIKPAGNYEEGKDYMVAVSPWVLEAFLKANQIDYVQLIRGQDLKNPPVGSIRYANEKEVVWYEYSSATTTRRCTDLSRAKSFVQEWVNLDCPTLKRFSTNQKVLSVNGFGAAVPLFESPLVDTSYVDTVIADDIEDKEIEGLRKHLNPDGVISQLLNNVQKARAEKEIDEVESRVKQVETQIRLFLRTPEIENEIKDIETAHLNEEGGFDCGFIFWYPKADSQLEKDMSLLVGANRRKLSWLDIAVPTFSQSINVQRYGAELIKKLVKERLGIELYYRSELD